MISKRWFFDIVIQKGTQKNNNTYDATYKRRQNQLHEINRQESK
jgi:hypothetical protein